MLDEADTLILRPVWITVAAGLWLALGMVAYLAWRLP